MTIQKVQICCHMIHYHYEKDQLTMTNNEWYIVDGIEQYKKIHNPFYTSGQDIRP